jgi:hypothetical protein
MIGNEDNHRLQGALSSGSTEYEELNDLASNDGSVKLFVGQVSIVPTKKYNL